MANNFFNLLSMNIVYSNNTVDSIENIIKLVILTTVTTNQQQRRYDKNDQPAQYDGGNVKVHFFCTDLIEFLFIFRRKSLFSYFFFAFLQLVNCPHGYTFLMCVCWIYSKHGTHFIPTPTFDTVLLSRCTSRRDLQNIFNINWMESFNMS